MPNLYVKNPNYNPLDPRSNRYVTDTQAQQEADKRAVSINDLFAPFTSLASGLFKPYSAADFYTPLPQNANVVQTSKTGAPVSTPPVANFTSAQATPNAASVVNTKAAGATAAVPATGQPATTPNSVSDYVVKAGDTLSAIAARNGTTVAELARINGIANPNVIQVGQQLRLSGAPAAGGGSATIPSATGGTNVAAAIQQTAQQKGGALTTQEIAALAKQAGEAGMSSSDFLSILQANATPTSSQIDEIRTKLGIPNLVDEAFKKPTKSTIDTYKELYDLAGLRGIQDKIAKVDESIAKKRADLVTATGELNNNPWISQATRAGRLKNLQELAFADINNDIELRKSYLDTYDLGVEEIERQLGFIRDDRTEARELTVEQLNYALNEAERLTTQAGQDTITAGLRNIPEFLEGVLSRESTQQARDLEKIRAQKAGTGGSNAILELLAAGGDSGSAENLVRASAGGKATTDTFRTSYEKTLNTLYQLSDLNKAFETYKETSGDTGVFGLGAGSELTGPIIGIIRSANPYDTKAQQIKAQLTAIVPNLARGVYGEVGVLTDQDIALYSQTLPNLKSTKEVRDALLAISAKSVYRALENKLLVQAKGGVDVSGYASDLTNMRDQVNQMLTAAGVPVESEVTGGTGYSAADADYVKSLGL